MFINKGEAEGIKTIQDNLNRVNRKNIFDYITPRVRVVLRTFYVVFYGLTIVSVFLPFFGYDSFLSFNLVNKLFISGFAFAIFVIIGMFLSLSKNRFAEASVFNLWYFLYLMIYVFDAKGLSLSVPPQVGGIGVIIFPVSLALLTWVPLALIYMRFLMLTFLDPKREQFQNNNQDKPTNP